MYKNSRRCHAPVATLPFPSTRGARHIARHVPPPASSARAASRRPRRCAAASGLGRVPRRRPLPGPAARSERPPAPLDSLAARQRRPARLGRHGWPEASSARAPAGRCTCSRATRPSSPRCLNDIAPTSRPRPTTGARSPGSASCRSRAAGGGRSAARRRRSSRRWSARRSGTPRWRSRRCWSCAAAAAADGAARRPSSIVADERLRGDPPLRGPVLGSLRRATAGATPRRTVVWFAASRCPAAVGRAHRRAGRTGPSGPSTACSAPASGRSKLRPDSGGAARDQHAGRHRCRRRHRVSRRPATASATPSRSVPAA